jgi:prepilin-type N-terminal cleavage/methylation domain-containing protein
METLTGVGKHFLSDHHSLPQYFGAATACSLNSQPIIFGKQPANHTNRAKDPAGLNFLGSLCFSVILRVLWRSSLFGAIPRGRDPRFFPVAPSQCSDMIRAPVFPRGRNQSGLAFAALRASAHPSDHRSLITDHSVRAGFTLLELLVVMGIIALLMVLVVPAFTNIKSGGDVTSAAYTIKGVLDTARTYAKANNTYTWVGFYEEDGSISSTNPATAGNGRIVMSIVASKDGTQVYTSVASPAADMDSAGTRLLQVGKLVKLDNMHLRTFSNGTGAGAAATFPTRPPVPGGSPDNAKIGDTSPPDSLRYFHYPPTATEGAAQYKFRKMIQFSPRGECRPQNDNYEMRAIMEVSFQPIRGTAVASVDSNKNCAIQLTGFGGTVKIYQR